MKHFFLLFWLLSPFALLAQNDRGEPLSTDRPGEGTNASSVVGVGVVQVEAGVLREWEQQFDNTFWNVPTVLLRFGVVDRLELRLTSGLFTNRIETAARWSPVSVGTKIAITEQRGWLPKTSLEIGFTLPHTGSPSAQSRFTQPSITLLTDHTVTSWLGITTNLGANWENDSPETIYRYGVSFNFGLSDRLGAFTEFYGDLPEASASSHLFNGGFTFLISNNLQLDLAAGTALTENAPDFYVGGGISVRW